MNKPLTISAEDLAAALKSGEYERVNHLLASLPAAPPDSHCGLDGPGTLIPSLVGRLLGFCLGLTTDDSQYAGGDAESAHGWFQTLELALEKGFSPFHHHGDPYRPAAAALLVGHAGAELAARLREIHSWRDAHPLTWEMGAKIFNLLVDHGLELDAPLEPVRHGSPSWREALAQFPDLRAAVAQRDAQAVAAELPPARATPVAARL